MRSDYGSDKSDEDSKQSLVDLGYLQAMAELAYLKIKYIIYDRIAGKNVDPEEVRSRLEKMDQLRWHLNHNKEQNLDYEFIDLLVRTEFFALFPKPTTEDTGYAKFYNTACIMRDKIFLSHRFEITGQIKQGDYAYNLHGAFHEVMVVEMALSFNQFVKDGSKRIVSKILQPSKYSALGEEALDGILRAVSEDVGHVILSVDKELVNQHSQPNEVLLLAPSLRDSATSSHAISMSLYNNMCFISDKMRSGNPGVEVYELQDDQETIVHKKQELATEFVTNVYRMRQSGPLMDSQAFSSNMVKVLNMKKIRSIPFKPQYGENCTWSSCAKLVLFSALYFRLYSAAKEIPEIKFLAPAQAESAAHELAEKYSKKIHRLWSDYDKFNALKSYIAQYSSPETKGQGPDPVLLAYIYLKYQYRNDKERFIKLIEDTKLVDGSRIAQAREIGLQRVIALMQEEHPILSRIFAQDISEISRRFAELYMISGKKDIEKVYNSIAKFSLSPFKTAIKILDQAINDAKEAAPTKTSYRRHSFLNFDQLSTSEEEDAMKKTNVSQESSPK